MFPLTFHTFSIILLFTMIGATTEEDLNENPTPTEEDNQLDKQQTDADQYNTFDIKYTDRPTETPTARPTRKPSEENSSLVHKEIPELEIDLSSTYVTEPWKERDTIAPPEVHTRVPRPTTTPPLDILVIDDKDDVNQGDMTSSEFETVNKSDQVSPTKKEGLSLGALIGITLALLVFIFFGVAFSVAAYNGYRPKTHYLRQQCFSIVGMVRLTGSHYRGKDKHNKAKEREPEETLISPSASVVSEEIEFSGPLFDTWPTTDIPNNVSDDLTDNNIYGENASGALYDEEDHASSKAFHIPARTGDMEPWSDDQLVLTDNAIDEIKKAINHAQWQDVYYLASKMAAQGNIDSSDNLASAIVRSSDSELYDNVSSRAHLSPEDAERATRLDVSLAVGDWVNLAARAAVYAALECADSSIPSTICFDPKKRKVHSTESQGHHDNSDDSSQEIQEKETFDNDDENKESDQVDEPSSPESWQRVDEDPCSYEEVSYDESSVNSLPLESNALSQQCESQDYSECRPQSFPLSRSPRSKSNDPEEMKGLL